MKNYVLPESSERPTRRLSKSCRQCPREEKGPGAQESDPGVDLDLQVPTASDYVTKMKVKSNWV